MQKKRSANRIEARRKLFEILFDSDSTGEVKRRSPEALELIELTTKLADEENKDVINELMKIVKGYLNKEQQKATKEM